MNKKILLGLIATLGTAIFAIVQASAADTSTEMTTDGTITFYRDNKPTPVLFQKNLSLAYVPGQFDFGINTLNGVTGTKVYNQVGLSGSQYVAVSDDRDTKTGWTLQAGLDNFVVVGGTDTLANAELSMNFGAPQQYNIDITASDAAQSPKPNITDTGALSDITGAGFKGIPEFTSPTVLTAGGASKKVASYRYATGTTADTKTVGIASEVTNVKLTVKDHSTVKEAKYTSTVNWTLSDTATD